MKQDETDVIADKGSKWNRLKNVGAGLLVAGILFFAFAPDSLWYGLSGVSPVSERKAANDLTLPDLNGRLWSLNAQRGKVVLINYWATWCPPCRVETPGLVRLANNYRARGLEVVGISLDEDANAVPPFVAEYAVPYPILTPPDKAALSGAVEALPTTLLYDRQGRLAKRYVGAVSEAVFQQDIEQLLGEHS